MGKFNQISTGSINVIKLRVKGGEWEFEAEGDAKAVTQQFVKFQEIVNVWMENSPDKKRIQGPAQTNHGLHPGNKGGISLPFLDRIFETDTHSSILLCRTPPPGKESEAKLVLLLLLGYRELRGVGDVSVLALKQAIKQCLHPVVRLDRVLHNYIRDRFVIKIGRGKGGKYRLTPLGIKKALTLVDEVTFEWDDG